MKDIWDKPITADTDWGGDASTGGLPVSGKIVQEYIKSRLKTDDQLKAFIKAYLDENGMSEDQGYVTLATEQTIKAIKDFEAGLKIGGSLITYDKDLNAFILRANLVTEGGITARALLDEIDVPTFMDGVVTDEVTISKADGVLRVLKAGLDKEELINILEEEKYVTQSWVKSYNAEELKKYVLKTDLPSDIVTLSIDQEITGIKNFANGFEIAGIKFYKSQDGTIFLDGNLVTSGGITSRGTNTTTTPSLFDALPIDGRTIKRDANKMLYVDETALNVSGGLDEEQLKDYLTKNQYVTRDDILSISGVTYDAVVAALGYTPLSTAGGTVHGNLEVLALTVEASNEINGYQREIGTATGSVHLNYRSSGNVTIANGGGNVAVGGTTATEKLHVHGNALIRDSFTVAGVLSTYKGSSSVAYLHITNETMTVDYAHLFVSNLDKSRKDRPLVLQNGYGNVAIGGITASEKLHVYGNLLVVGGFTARYTSDRRLKQNIRPFRASEMLMSLGGVYQFEYIDSEVEKNHIYGGSHVGLIYQNVVGSALDRMCYKGEDGYGSLNYLEPSFISLIAGATLENTSEIEQLKKRVKLLEAKK